MSNAQISLWSFIHLEEDRILIVAVMHCSREPGYWKERVREKPPDGDNEL